MVAIRQDNPNHQAWLGGFSHGYREETTLWTHRAFQIGRAPPTVAQQGRSARSNRRQLSSSAARGDSREPTTSLDRGHGNHKYQRPEVLLGTQLAHTEEWPAAIDPTDPPEPASDTALAGPATHQHCSRPADHVSVLKGQHGGCS